jgi:hypothetical protein
MPKWLQGMFAPTLMLWLYALALGTATAFSPEGGLSWRAELLSSWALSYVLASWVVSDARKRRKKLYYDYDSLVFFGWPIVIPFYLFQTRGWRALLTLLCFLAIWLVAVLMFVAIFLIREFP